MSIQIHYIKGHPYAYDHNRVGDKVVCTYLGRRFDIPSVPYKSKEVTQQNIFEYSDKIDSKFVDEIKEIYKGMPSKQRKLLREIEIQESHERNLTGHAYDDKIFIYQNTLKQFDIETKKQVVYHETAHVILNDNYRKQGTKDLFEFIDAVEKEGTHSKYAQSKKNTSAYEKEVFCEIHGDISSKKGFTSEFKRKYPESYRTYNKIIEHYR